MGKAKKELKEYLHYYLGSKFKYVWPNGEYVVATLNSVNKWNDIFGSDGVGTGVDESGWYEINNYNEGKLQLILLHTSDMTKEQMKEYKDLCYKILDLKDDTKVVRFADTPESMHYLFKNSIDAFDLIESGLAIDITVFKSQQHEINV